MRRAVLLASLLLLCGCESLLERNSDSFEQGAASQAKFDADNRSCQQAANDYLSYEVHGAWGTEYNRNRTYNRLYGDCMKKRGYGDRTWVKNYIPQMP